MQAKMKVWCSVPSASRGDQCPEGAHGLGDEELEAYCSRTLPSVHLSHTDPTSLGNQQTGTATNLDTDQIHNIKPTEVIAAR